MIKEKKDYSPFLDNILFKEFKVLDHGFIRVIDYMGNELSAVKAARVSYKAHEGKEKTQSENNRLIDYLIRHSHTSPFEMCEIKFHIKMPIFIARQWLRHRTANVNEVSGRYTETIEEAYIPQKNRMQGQSLIKKQCSDKENIISDAENAVDLLKAITNESFSAYNDLLSKGLAKELARLSVTLNRYTELYWKIDLHNLLHFVRLRSSDGAQLEIKEYSDIILNIIEGWVPNIHKSFMNHIFNSQRLSQNSIKALKSLIHKKDLSDILLSKNEINLLEDLFDIDIGKEIIR